MIIDSEFNAASDFKEHSIVSGINDFSYVSDLGPCAPNKKGAPKSYVITHVLRVSRLNHYRVRVRVRVRVAIKA